MRGASDYAIKRKAEAERLRVESGQRHIEFLKTELDSCFTFASTAETERTVGHDEPAERSLADAEKGYATLSRLLSDPKHAAHIPLKAHRDFTTELRRLRKTLDDLRRFMGVV